MGHHLFTDGNGNKVVLFYKFGLHRKADPVNALLAYLVPFSKDHIVVSDFSNSSLFGEFSFTRSSHINVEMGQIVTHKYCSLWTFCILDVHQHTYVQCTDSQRVESNSFCQFEILNFDRKNGSLADHS